MIDHFTALSKILKRRPVVIDHWVFQLHRLSVYILLGCTVIVTTKQYVGEPIDCFAAKDSVPNSIMNSHCWTLSTFTLSNKGRVSLDEIYSRVGIYDPEKGGVIYHQYYQWVPFILLLQAILFYIPRYLWKIWEGNQVESMVEGLRPTDIMEDSEERIAKLVEIFYDDIKKRRKYVLSFVFCEFLAFINILAQIYFMDIFLNREFSTFGIDVLNFIFIDEYRDDPMTRVFPLRTKCTYPMFGPTLNIISVDGLCVLPINVFNEKIYVFLWFWFLLVAGLTVLSYIIQLITFCRYFQNLFLSPIESTSRKNLEIVTSKSYYSDWFLLNLLKKNMYPEAFCQFIDGVARKLENSPSNETV